MKMVRHQGEGIENESQLLFIALDTIEELSSFLLIEKNMLPLIAADNHMIEGPWEFYTRRSCHDEPSYQNRCIFASLTP